MSDLADKIVDGKNTRANVRILITQLGELSARGVPVSKELAEGLSSVCDRLLASNNPRIQATACKLILAMLKHNLELVALADKMTRLDNGQATERIDCPVKLIEGIDPKAFP